VDIDVIFDISADGIVSVSAIDVQTGTRQSITVTARPVSPRRDQEGRAIERGLDARPEGGSEFQDRKNRAEELFREFEPSGRDSRARAQRPRTGAAAARAGALSVARLQLAQRESDALAGSLERLERMLQALRGALERSQGGLDGIQGGGGRLALLLEGWTTTARAACSMR